MISASRALVSARLRVEARTAEIPLIVIPFGAVALLSVPLAVGIDTPLLARIGSGLFWAVVLLFGAMIPARGDSDRPHREMVSLLGIDPAVQFVATSASAAILLLGFESALFLLTAVLYAPPLGDWPWLLLLFPLVAAGLAMLGSISSRVVADAGQAPNLALLLTVPVAIPILLAASQATVGLQGGGGILRWILLLAVVDTLLALVGVLTARPLEES